jgi:AraC-like DNA-binding protein
MKDGRAAVSEPLLNVRLETGELPQAERQRAYLDAINAVLETKFLTADFHARLDAYFVGTLHLIWLRAGARRSTRTVALFGRDRYDGIGFQYIVEGQARGEAGARTVVSDPGTVMILDYSQPFSIRDLGDRTVINVAVPREDMREMVGDPSDLHGVVLDVEASGLIGAFLTDLHPRLATLSINDGPVLARVLRDLIAISLRATDRTKIAAPQDRHGRLLDRAYRIIDARLGSANLTPEMLAEKLNVSRSDLYSVFQDQGGVSKAIWRRRIEAAHAALLDPLEMRRIGELSYAFGFSSEAHFARAFKAAYGTTASVARRSSQSGTI